MLGDRGRQVYSVGSGSDGQLANLTGLAAEPEQLLVQGPAAPSLLRAAQDSSIPVVRSRGRASFAGLLLGRLVIRGDVDKRAFNAFWLVDNRVMARNAGQLVDEGIAPVQELDPD